MKLGNGIQTNFPAIESLENLKTTISELEEVVTWSDIGILFDKDNQSTLILLLDNNQVDGVLRFSLDIHENIEAINILRSTGEVFLGGYDNDFRAEDVCSLDKINTIWISISALIVKVDNPKLEEFFLRTRENVSKTGRGKKFTTRTINEVMFESRGYCMFEGCGQDLRTDELTGKKGNYSYLAHNIASSENGARGLKVISELLSDEPSNVLLLCDKHHRLVDRIAVMDYPSAILSQMRDEFISACNNLLKSLAYQPIPAFSIAWPVGGKSVAAPTEEQISQCFSKIRARLLNQIYTVNDNESFLRATTSNEVWAMMPNVIERTANNINMQIHNCKYRAGLFAFGPMPSLIALGAKLGNKNDIIPMLRYRDGGTWVWPSDKPQGVFYNINGMDTLTTEEDDIIISLVTTNEPSKLKSAAQQISGNLNAKIIEIKANELGNGALAHPDDGIAFRAYVHKLFHQLKDDFNVKRIHLLPCTSNAICIFFGQAFDIYHPNLIIYDYHEQTMVPRLIIKSENDDCKVMAVSKGLIN